MYKSDQCIDCLKKCDEFAVSEKVLRPGYGLAFHEDGTCEAFRNGGIIEIICPDREAKEKAATE